MMIRQVVGRTVSRNGSSLKAVIPKVSLSRNNSTTSSTTASTGTTTAEVPTPASAASTVQPPVNLRSGPVGKSNKNRQPMNQKLRDITFQIRQAVDSSSTDLSESIQILEEGLAYLREVQKAEGIPEDFLYGSFQGIVVNLFQKAQKPGVTLGSKSMDELFDLLVQYNIAHGYHFAHMMSRKLINDGGDYNAVLNYWIKYLEYSTLQPHSSRMYKCYNNKINNHKDVSYFRSDVINIAYYSYVQSLIEQKIEFEPKLAYKILQTEDIPSVYNVGQTIVRFRIKPSMDEYRKTFGDAIDSINIESTDPNGPIIVNRIVASVEKRNPFGITKVYEQILAASARNGKPIQEPVLTRIMGAYAELQEYDRVLDVFQRMVTNGLTKPSTHSWELMLLALCNPKRVKGIDAKQREALTAKVEQCIATMEQNGNVFKAKTLAIIIGCYANLNQMDKAEELITGERRLGKKQQGAAADASVPAIPIVHLAKNNYLTGLILNNQITTAEIKLKEFQTADPNFVPSLNVLNSFLQYYVRNKKFKAVDGILKYMHDNHASLDLTTYTILIDMHFKINREKGQSPSIETIFELLNDAKVTNNIKLNEIAMGTIIDGLCKDGSNIEAARLLFKYVQKNMKLTAPLTTIMLEAELEFGSVPESRSLFEIYKQQFSNSERIWNLMVRGLLKREDDLAMEYFNKFKRQPPSAGIKPNHFTYYYLLSHFIKKDNKEVVQILINDLNGGALKNLGTHIPKILRAHEREYKINKDLLAYQ